jgi:putative transposase
MARILFAMGRLFHPLLFFLAKCARHELIRQIEFLHAENQMLRAHLKQHHVYLSSEERARLVELGRAVGPAIRHIISIVTPETFVRWARVGPARPIVRRPGRPRTSDELRALVLKIARETGWGYTRILGELRKLGMTKISRQTVVNILNEAGLEPGPRRGPGTWDEFLKMHAETLWQCDFFSKRILSRLGMPQVWAMVFINVATRRVWISSCTAKPSATWVAQQTINFLDYALDQKLPLKTVSRDNDYLYRWFDMILEARGVDSRRLAIRAPNTNAYVERFIQSLQVECLDHFLVFGEKHLDYLVREYVEHYHTERPHQGLGNRTIRERAPPPNAPAVDLAGVERRTRLGGLLSHYVRAA